QARPSPCAWTSDASAPNAAPATTRRGSAPKRARAAATASGSRSIASRRSWLPSRSSIRAVWPPRPKVASTYRRGTPGCARIASASTASSTSTGSCATTVFLPASCASQRQRGQFRGQLGHALLALHPFLELHLPAGLVPQFQAAALADDPRAGLEAGEFAQLRRERKSPMAVEVHFLRVADHQPLEAARLRVRAGHGVELRLDLFPLGKGIDAQALVAVHGHHHAAGRGRGQLGAVLCRHHYPALVINRDFCCAAEHASEWDLPTSTHNRPPAPILEPATAYVNGVNGFFCLCHKDLRAFLKVGETSQEPFGFRNLGGKARK